MALKILLTGGAGYIGTSLIPLLLMQGHKVRVLDKLVYGGESLVPYFIEPNFEFIRGDILDERTVRDALRGVDVVVHLAAIVGYPACKKNPQLAFDVNVTGTEVVGRNLEKGQVVIFASTGSNYGAIVGQVCTEETPVNPLTIYGETKTKAEQFLLERCDAIAFRFATAFGLSPRLRLDLLINDFVYQALKRKNLIVYEKTFKRTFIHVRDIARAFLFALDNVDRMVHNVYNVGSDGMNYSKEEIAQLIKQKIDFYLHFADVGTDEDQRNYEVSYRKLNALGYTTTIGIENGIDELIRGLQLIDVRNPYSNV